MPDLSVQSLTLSHFRSHKVLRLKVDARPVAIFGENGAGKTNILEALSLLSPGRGLRRATAEEIMRRPEQLGWKVHANLNSLGQSETIDTWAEPGHTRQVRINEKSATQVTLGRIVRVLWLVPSMDRLWIEGAEGRRRFLDRMTLSFEPGHADATLTYEKAMRERNRLLKDQVRDPHWYRALEQKMAETGAIIQQNRQAAIDALGQAQEQSETLFPAATLSLQHANDLPILTDSAELLAALSDNRPRDLAAGRTLVGPHRVDLNAIYATKNIAAKECSTGEQKALLVSLILANGRALIQSFGAAPLLLLDEVAAHLDDNRRAALYNEICALGGQAWMTGTEKRLFETLDDRAQYIKISDQGGESTMEMLQ
ncbi:DNA replication/repair protein RecF [Cochlodiniinecator piscidefendens]|uniref:DNA replication/repair protein RecF n=1 Tax=Cochlodiniinecator piscidefendens TaxID=2715756 RepID=UPI00140D4230|nr:DNA replication/repair protein RecF [Cochlodiniinecator piscidefendens]